jgi:glycosyltransferase involved in cell wall biosynthesis
MNRCCSLSSGEYLIVVDDDDWYHPTRISRQVAPFEDPDILVTGTGTLYYCVHGTQNAYRYENRTTRPWIGAFAIRRQVWEARGFNDIPIAADVKMLSHIPRRQWKDLQDLTLMVATIHPENVANGKKLPNAAFIETPWEEIKKITGELL